MPEHHVQDLLHEAPVEPSKRLSPHCALRGRNVTDSNFRLLKPADETGVPGVPDPYCRIRNVVRLLTTRGASPRAATLPYLGVRITSPLGAPLGEFRPVDKLWVNYRVSNQEACRLRHVFSKHTCRLRHVFCPHTCRLRHVFQNAAATTGLLSRHGDSRSQGYPQLRPAAPKVLV